jgi:hypothetical protein
MQLGGGAAASAEEEEEQRAALAMSRLYARRYSTDLAAFATAHATGGSDSSSGRGEHVREGGVGSGAVAAAATARLSDGRDVPLFLVQHLWSPIHTLLDVGRAVRALLQALPRAGQLR